MININKRIIAPSQRLIALLLLTIFAVSAVLPSSAFSHRPCALPPATIPLSIALAASPTPSRRSPFSLKAASKSSGVNEDVKIDGKSLLDGGNATHENPRKSILIKIKNKLQSANIKSAIRGNKYGTDNNSTILTPSDAAIKVGVRPTLEATKETWQRAWKFHRFMMNWLHRWDGCQPTDSKLALACLWWKAIAGNDVTSPVYDYQLSYDLLPPITRWAVHRRLCRLYPRLHHANVEIRTAYLDKSLSNVIASICSNENVANDASSEYPPTTTSCNNSIVISNDTKSTQNNPKKKIRLIVMGGGYDTRSFKLFEQTLLQKNTETSSLNHQLLQRKRQNKRFRRPLLFQQHNSQSTQQPDIDNAFRNISNCNFELECYELDLPEVVQAKTRLLQKRLARRRPWLGDTMANYLKLIPVDFNNLNETRRALEEIANANNNDDDDFQSDVNTIVLFEGVMIYLDEGIPHALLDMCSDVLLRGSSKNGGNGYLCFADRLENIPGGDEDAATLEMKSTGWELKDWLSKPGLARHMGIAWLSRN